MRVLPRGFAHPPSAHALRMCFGIALALVLAVSLWPMPEPPPINTGWDKTDHVAAFVVLGLLGLPSWPHDRVRVLVGLLVYGGLIEVLQGFTVYRQADWRDWVADAVGVGLAVLIFGMWRRKRKQA